jgi:FeS assembly SUF system protein
MTQNTDQSAAATDTEALRAAIVDALKGVYDPEIPVNIYDLGLIYDLQIEDTGKVDIKMTLTAPGCPVAQTFPGTVECAVKCVEGVNDARVELVWDPPWDKDRMTEAAKLQLGML